MMVGDGADWRSDQSICAGEMGLVGRWRWGGWGLEKGLVGHWRRACLEDEDGMGIGKGAGCRSEMGLFGGWMKVDPVQLETEQDGDQLSPHIWRRWR